MLPSVFVWVVSSDQHFAFSYVIGQVPSNMIIGKLRPSVYLTLMACVWSGVSAATCGVKGYEGLVAVRFVLGLVEAPLFPGVSS